MVANELSVFYDSGLKKRSYSFQTCCRPPPLATQYNVENQVKLPTSFPVSLILPPPAAPGDGKMRDPGNEVGEIACTSFQHCMLGRGEGGEGRLGR